MQRDNYFRWWNKVDARWFWIALGLFALLLGFIFGQCPACTEHWYSRGIFPLLRYVVDYTFGLLPFPVIYLLLPALIFAIVLQLRKSAGEQRSWKQRAGNVLLSLGAFTGGTIFLFQFLWGYNYNRIPLEKQMALPTTPITKEELEAEIQHFTGLLETLRPAISSDSTAALSTELVPAGLEDHLREQIRKVLSALGYPTPGRPRGRILWPPGVLQRFGSAGVYIPFTGECHVDGGLHHVSIPFTMAHELAHGYGIADEGSCNFLAYLSCGQSDITYVRYAGYLAYWRYLRFDYRYADPEAYAVLMKNLHPGVKADLSAIYAALDKYPEWMPKIRHFTYDTYLKAQGISEGIRNYDRVVLLVTSWRRSEEKYREND